MSDRRLGRSDEDARQREIDLGQFARECFDNEALQEAFDRLKKGYITAWADSKPSAGAEAREKMYFAFQAVEFVERELKVMLDNGRLAASENDEEQ